MAVSAIEGPPRGIAPKPLTYLTWLASIVLVLNIGWELAQRPLYASHHPIVPGGNGLALRIH